MKFISWSLNEPSNAQFAEYATEVAPGEWQILNPDAWKNWGGNGAGGDGDEKNSRQG